VFSNRVLNFSLKIEEGILADIHLAVQKKTKQEFVVKKVVHRLLHPRDAVSLNDEISVLRAVSDCKHVLGLQEVFEDPDCTCLVLNHFKGEIID
jgi:serine/threonine protein kinase